MFLDWNIFEGKRRLLSSRNIYWAPTVCQVLEGYRNEQDWTDFLALIAPQTTNIHGRFRGACTSLTRHHEHLSHVHSGLDLIPYGFLPFREEQVTVAKTLY